METNNLLSPVDLVPGLMLVLLQAQLSLEYPQTWLHEPNTAVLQIIVACTYLPVAQPIGEHCCCFDDGIHSRSFDNHQDLRLFSLTCSVLSLAIFVVRPR